MVGENCAGREKIAFGARLGLPRRRWYPLLGALLALWAPIGYVALRYVSAERRGAWPGLEAEIVGQSITYGYITFATLGVFMVVGWLFGRKEDELERISSTDALTGLHNRRFLRARLAQEIERALRYKTPLSMLLIDLDGLKIINDKHGHAAGDRALARVGLCLARTCRASDITSRYGGDEFVVVVPETDGPRALELAERIRAGVRGDDPSSPLAVSIGVAELGGSRLDPDARHALEAAPALEAARAPDTLLEAADRALYRAKAEGRDRSILDGGPASAASGDGPS